MGAPGREEVAVESFRDATAYCPRLEDAGEIEPHDEVLLDPYGGLDGFMLIKGRGDQLAGIAMDSEWQQLCFRANVTTNGFGMVGGSTGDAVPQQMGAFLATTIPARGREAAPLAALGLCGRLWVVTPASGIATLPGAGRGVQRALKGRRNAPRTDVQPTEGARRGAGPLVLSPSVGCLSRSHLARLCASLRAGFASLGPVSDRAQFTRGACFLAM